MPGNTFVYSTCLLMAVLCVAVLATHGLNEDAVRQTIRLTAATSFGLLICAFAARPLYQLNHSSLARSLLHQRRQIGISVAVSHSYHLLTIFLLNWVLFDGGMSFQQSLADLGPGIAVYVILYAMALTSNSFSQRLLGKNWKRLHRFGIYSLMIAFTAAYTGKAIESGGLYWLISSAGLAAFLLRVLAWQRQRTPQHSGDTVQN
ncbi:MAG: hypothetical protein IMF06_14155 [Proteobacteria bacterium]|nr:hypothetical protein [Pseudomonadota bacterium]